VIISTCSDTDLASTTITTVFSDVDAYIIG